MSMPTDSLTRKTTFDAFLSVSDFSNARQNIYKTRLKCRYISDGCERIQNHKSSCRMIDLATQRRSSEQSDMERQAGYKEAVTCVNTEERG